VPLVEDYGVEGVAARLDPDPPQDAFASAGLQGQTVDERLGDGLQRERQVVIPCHKNLAVRGRKADGEPLAFYSRRFRFVVAGARLVVAHDLVVVQRQVPPVQLVEAPVYPVYDLLVQHTHPPTPVLFLAAYPMTVLFGMSSSASRPDLQETRRCSSESSRVAALLICS
jgi:hypothetical protein